MICNTIILQSKHTAICAAFAKLDFLKRSIEELGLLGLGCLLELAEGLISAFAFDRENVALKSSSGLAIILGLRSTTGTLLKCSIGIFILEQHFAHTVRLHRVHLVPHGPKIPKRVFKHRKHTLRFSTSLLTWPSGANASTSAFVSTVRMCTISSSVNDRRSSREMASCQGFVLLSWIAWAISGVSWTDSASELVQDCLEHGRDCGTDWLSKWSV